MTVPDPPGAVRQPGLTALRGVAALLVVITHVAFWTEHTTPTIHGRWLGHLDVGVAIFFALSGYLLITPWLVHADGRGSAPSLRRYARHRIRRIVPAYVLVVGLGFGLLKGAAPFDGEDVLRHLTFTQIYGRGHLHEGLTQTWSLATEVSFYAALPAIGILFVRRGRMSGSALAAVLVAMGLAFVPLTHLLPSASGASLWLPAHLAWFAAGLLAAALVREGAGLPSVLPAAVLGVALLAATGFSWADGSSVDPGTMGADAVRAALYTGVAFSGLAIAHGLRDAAVPRFLLWLGEISYELFLIHLIVLIAVSSAEWGLAPTLGLTLAISLVLAWMIKRLVDLTFELPRDLRAARAG